MKYSLPIDSAVRKTYPLFSGLFGYFAAALGGVAHHSHKNNQKHNPGQPLHWSVDKSTDHADCIPRHLVDLHDVLRQIELHDAVVPKGYGAATREDYIKVLLDEANALAWRSLALSQSLHQRFANAPLPFNAKLSTFAPQNPADVDEARAMLGVAGYPSLRCAHCKDQPCSCAHRAQLPTSPNY